MTQNEFGQKIINTGLVPGLADFMDGALPNENEESVGEGVNISKEVDENGDPLNFDDQEAARTEDNCDWEYRMRHRRLLNGKMETTEEPSGQSKWTPATGKMPYCPVFATQKPNGGRIFEAYITGTVEDVDEYIDLIDTLLTASEQDEYFIYEDSPGGYVASGGIIASAIHHSKANVFTVARGLCASSAALIHSAAKPGNAVVTLFAIMMYHMSSHFAVGVSTQIAREAIDQVRYVNECLLNKAKDDGHITEEEFKQIQNGEEIFIPAHEFIKRTQKTEGEPAATGGTEA